MENLSSLRIIAQRAKDRAETVRNRRSDVVSKMARGVLGVERWLADRVLEKNESKIELPRPLKAIEQDQESFFRIMHDIEGGIMMSLRKQHPFRDPGQFPKLNMCGYTSSAMTEFLKGQGLAARVVYGHYRTNGEVMYHYWTEADIEGQKYVIDATYGQFDPALGEKILFYQSDDLGMYGLREYRPEDKPVLGDVDRSTLAVLVANSGVLPMREHIQDESQRQKYEELTRVFA